jgi:hypothetical protein
MKALVLATIAVGCSFALPTAQTPEPHQPIDAAAVATFADEFLPAEMARRQIPGLVLAVVADGKLAGARGYGAAQLDPRRPVDPQRTVFGVASVSKLMTATAIMQLVEQGRLDLHRDVNDYLNAFRLPARHGARPRCITCSRTRPASTSGSPGWPRGLPPNSTRFAATWPARCPQPSSSRAVSSATRIMAWRSPASSSRRRQGNGLPTSRLVPYSGA